MSASVVSPKMREFIEEAVVRHFDEYARIGTASDAKAKVERGAYPSTDGQVELINLAAEHLGSASDRVRIDDHKFVYATLNGNAEGDSFGLLSHVDSSPERPGNGVVPRYIRNYDGSIIHFPKNSELVLDPKVHRYLLEKIGKTIITASGDTLLAADDKSGLAINVAAFETFKQFSELRHPTIVACVAHDEEIAMGTEGIDLTALPKICYTLDGGPPNELELETFDAYGMTIKITGKGSHPGAAQGNMISSMHPAASLISVIGRNFPMPEGTSGREGFIYIGDAALTTSHSEIRIIFRDFDEKENIRRMDEVEKLAKQLEDHFPGIKVNCPRVRQYPNMKEFIDATPEAAARAIKAIEDTGLTLVQRPIRGGTDGSKLSAAGHPCPNLGTGMQLIHSELEWISVDDMVTATEVVLNLSNRFVTPD